MKNPKILLFVIGGVTLLAALVLGWFNWDEFSSRAGAIGEREDAESRADRLIGLPVRPSRAAIADVRSNANAFVAWRTNALAAISRGDRTFPQTTPPAFKTHLISEARRLSSLPGSAGGRLVKPDFPFGFKDYITGGILPKRDDLPRLQREWSDLVTVVELLSTNGVAEILDVRFAAAGAAPAAEENAKAKKKKRAKAATNAEVELKPDVSRFEVDFLARPEALVAAVNAFAASARFIVVEDFSFVRERDVIAEALGAEEKASAEKAPAGGRRARRRAAAEKKAAEEKAAEEKSATEKTGVVTDPATAAPLKVTMKFAVSDFRSGGAKAATAAEGGSAK